MTLANILSSLLLLALCLTFVLGTSAENTGDLGMELQKRDKWSSNKGFSDYNHLRFGRADPALNLDYLPPYYPAVPYFAEKRALSDYGHLRFGTAVGSRQLGLKNITESSSSGRRMPSFTDYGHLRFGK